MSDSTFFASTNRASADELEQENNDILETPFIPELLNAMPLLIAILNEDRQVVQANNALLELLGITNINSIIGARPGELFGCVHAHEMPAGCGTAEACQHCGAVRAVTECLKFGGSREYEARIATTSLSGPASLDIRVKASTIVIRNHRYVITTIQDISDENRRKILEKVFFHDLTNSVGSLQGLIELLPDSRDDKEYHSLIEHLSIISNSLVDEIMAQKQLSAAEAGELTSNKSLLPLPRYIHDLVDRLLYHPVCEGRKIYVDDVNWPKQIVTDPVLLARVLINLLKNAVEASKKSETVTVSADISEAPKRLGICVHNSGIMPREVQLQLFQRSFSTKGEARGLGTYSIKLFTERFLNGKISFISNAQVQTQFTLWLPLATNDA